MLAKREVERDAHRVRQVHRVQRVHRVHRVRHRSAPDAPDAPDALSRTSASKIGFADRKPRSARGSPITSSYFAGQSDVLDVGCGRGEFLELLRDAGIPAKGLDLNPEMVEVCRARGLDANGRRCADLSCRACRTSHSAA